jgi:hypothetical protein
MSNFKLDLARGQRGEQALLERFPTLIKTDGRAYDFVTVDGLKIETKFDSTKYSNIFLEVIRNDNNQTPGGAWQSLFKQADLFVYVFERDNSTYCYKVHDLVWFLFQTKGKYDEKRIWNRGYNSIGYAIPIEDLKHLELSLEAHV